MQGAITIHKRSLRLTVSYVLCSICPTVFYVLCTYNSFLRSMSNSFLRSMSNRLLRPVYSVPRHMSNSVLRSMSNNVLRPVSSALHPMSNIVLRPTQRRWLQLQIQLNPKNLQTITTHKLAPYINICAAKSSRLITRGRGGPRLQICDILSKWAPKWAPH